MRTLALVAVVLAGTATAAAQPRGDSARARALFDEGVTLGDQQRWPEATAKFRQALALRDAPAIRYNLGAALAEQRQWDEAITHLQHVVDDEEAPEELRQRANTALLNARAQQNTEQQQISAEAAAASTEPTAGQVFSSPYLWGTVALAVLASVVITLIVTAN